MDSTILIDPAKIAERIKSLKGQIDDLNALLSRLDMLREFAVSPSPTNGRGRRKHKNPLIEILRQYVEAHEEFDHQALKTALGNPSRKDWMRDAIQAVIDEGKMEIAIKPMGRQPGLYRRLENGNGSN